MRLHRIGVGLEPAANIPPAIANGRANRCAVFVAQVVVAAIPGKNIASVPVTARMK